MRLFESLALSVSLILTNRKIQWASFKPSPSWANQLPGAWTVIDPFLDNSINVMSQLVNFDLAMASWEKETQPSLLVFR